MKIKHFVYFTIWKINISQFEKLLNILSIQIIYKNKKINSIIKLSNISSFVILIFAILKFRNVSRFTFRRLKFWSPPLLPNTWGIIQHKYFSYGGREPVESKKMTLGQVVSNSTGQVVSSKILRIFKSKLWVTLCGVRLWPSLINWLLITIVLRLVLTLWPKIRISGLSGYPNPKLQIRIIRTSVLSVLFGYPDIRITRIIRVSELSVLSGYPNYPDIRIIRIRISDYHEITDCI